MMSKADIEGKLIKCSHAHSQDSIIHPSTDFKMSEWSSASILCILIGWVTGKGSIECHVVLFDTYSHSPNYRELDKSRHDENYYSRRNRELDNSRRDENSNARHNRELSNSLLRRDLLFSFLFLWWFFGELAILVEFSDENYWKFDENYWILSSNSVILVEISTRIAGFEERIQ